MKKKKILFVVGARPNFAKVAVLLKLIDERGKFKSILVHTGQHYDYNMSRSFFEDLEIRRPEYFLDAGGGARAWQTGKIMERLEKVCRKEKPDLVIVVGDVNSTLAASIAARKLGIRTAHIESGLRSRDMSMPEEINRLITDRLSDLLFVTEKSGMENLLKEGIIASSSGKGGSARAFFVGNTMIDSLRFGLARLKAGDVSKFSVFGLKRSLKEYAVMTLHRPSNVGDQRQLERLMSMLGKIARDIDIVFPMHPGTRKFIKKFKIKMPPRIHAIAPLRYLEFLYLYKDAKFILTDSGGIQEESTALKIPCLTLRKNTERPVTVNEGTNIVVGGDLGRAIREAGRILSGKVRAGRIPSLWDGKASLRIMNVLDKELSF